MATLMNPEAGRRELNNARDELVQAGKAAIPPLLNGLVPNKDLRTPLEGISANMLINALREITGMDFGFTATAANQPAGHITREASDKAMKRWFGWWRDRKDTWNGRAPEEPPDEDF